MGQAQGRGNGGGNGNGGAGLGEGDTSESEMDGGLGYTKARDYLDKLASSAAPLVVYLKLTLTYARDADKPETKTKVEFPVRLTMS